MLQMFLKQQRQRSWELGGRTLLLMIGKICPGFFSQRQDTSLKYLDSDNQKNPGIQERDSLINIIFF